MIKKSIFIAVLFLTMGIAHGQDDIVVPRDSLNTIAQMYVLSDSVANAVRWEDRWAAHKKLDQLLGQWLACDDYDTEVIRQDSFISVVVPDDGSFSLVTWQMLDGHDEYRYFGYLVRGSNVFRLEQGGADDCEYETRAPDNWVGAIYYNVLPVDDGQKKYYVLFGYNGLDVRENMKVIDVLTFDPDPVFGAEIFEMPSTRKRKDIKSRLVIKYFEKAMPTVNYDPDLGIIIIDHLVSVPDPSYGLIVVTDGSYEGYQWKGKRFQYIAKVFDRTLEKPPRPFPVFGGKNKKDIFGRPRKQ